MIELLRTWWGPILALALFVLSVPFILWLSRVQKVERGLPTIWGRTATDFVASIELDVLMIWLAVWLLGREAIGWRIAGGCLLLAVDRWFLKTVSWANYVSSRKATGDAPSSWVLPVLQFTTELIGYGLVIWYGFWFIGQGALVWKIAGVLLLLVAAGSIQDFLRREAASVAPHSTVMERTGEVS